MVEITFGKKLKTIRVEQGLTQKKLANKLKVAVNTISNWENNKATPTKNIIEDVAKELKIDKKELEKCIEENPVIETTIEKLYKLKSHYSVPIDAPKLASKYLLLSLFPRTSNWLSVNNLYGTNIEEELDKDNKLKTSKGTRIARHLMFGLSFSEYIKLLNNSETKNIILEKSNDIKNLWQVELKNGFYEDECIEFSKENGIRLTEKGLDVLKIIERIANSYHQPT